MKETGYVCASNQRKEYNNQCWTANRRKQANANNLRKSQLVCFTLETHALRFLEISLSFCPKNRQKLEQKLSYWWLCFAPPKQTTDSQKQSEKPPKFFRRTFQGLEGAVMKLSLTAHSPSGPQRDRQANWFSAPVDRCHPGLIKQP